MDIIGKETYLNDVINIIRDRNITSENERIDKLDTIIKPDRNGNKLVNLFLKNENNENPLLVACYLNNFEVVRYLLMEFDKDNMNNLACGLVREAYMISVNTRGITDNIVLLLRIVDMAMSGTDKLEWIGASDEHECYLCKKRNGKIYTISEAKKIVGKIFCKHNRCRCTFLPVT